MSKSYSRVGADNSQVELVSKTGLTTQENHQNDS